MALQGLQDGVLPAFATFGSSRSPWACGPLPPISAILIMQLVLCICVYLLFSLTRNLLTGLRATHIHDGLTSTSLNESTKTLFPDTVLFTCSGGTHLLGPPFNPLKVKITQSCLTLCDPLCYSLPGSSVHGIIQARILECVAVPFSRGSSQPRDQT